MPRLEMKKEKLINIQYVYVENSEESIKLIMSLVGLHNTRSIYKNQFYVYILTKSNLKLKFKMALK